MHRIDVIGVVINDFSDYQASTQNVPPETIESRKEILQDAAANNWCIFENELKYSRGFPKMMRGNYNQTGKALPMFSQFANELFKRLKL